MVVCLRVLATAKIHRNFCFQNVSLQKIQLKLFRKVQVIVFVFFTYWNYNVLCSKLVSSDTKKIVLLKA